MTKCFRFDRGLSISQYQAVLEATLFVQVRFIKVSLLLRAVSGIYFEVAYVSWHYVHSPLLPTRCI